MSNSIGEIALDLVVNPSKFKQQMNGITKTAKSSTNALTGMFKKVGVAVVAAFSVRAIVNFSKECLQLGSDLAEVQNVVDVTFGSMSSAVDKWAKNAMTQFGMSEKVAKEYMGQFGAMSKAFGNNVQTAYDQATKLTGLAGDVASFYNMSTEEAFTKLKAVYTGETEALKTLGVVMTQSALDEYALAKGYGKTTDAMSEQEKVALRLAFVTDRLSDASGDFARTSDGWANQTRVLALRFDALKASIGQGLINALLPVVRVLNTILERLQVVADAFANFMANIFGDAGPVSSAVSSATSGTEAISSNLDDAEDSAKALKKSLAGFDQINVLSSKADQSGGKKDSGEIIPSTDLTPTVDDVKVESGALAAIKEWFATLPKLEFDVDWAAVGTNVMTGLQNLWTSIQQWAHFVLTIAINIVNDLSIDELIMKLSELWVAFTGLIENITNILKPALVDFYSTAISPIVQWIGEKLTDAVQFVIDLFNDWGKWFTDNQESIKSFIDMLADFVAGLWNIIEPIGDAVWDTFKAVIEKISEIFQGFFKWILDNKETVVSAIVAITTALIAYKTAVGISSLIEKFKNGITALTNAENLAAIAQAALNAVMNANPVAIIIAAVAGLAAGFIALWNTSEDFRNFFINMWEGIKKAVTGVINGILGGFEGFINGIIGGLNSLIRAINRISFDVPDWVPVIGGKKFGFNLKEINKVSLPRLANGGYVAANTPQLAIIGDNKHEGEIVAPESKITEAVVAAFRQFLPLFNSGNNKPIYLTLKLGDGTFWEGFVDYHNDIVKRTGDTPLLV